MAVTTRQSNPKRTVVAINASGGALVLISASKFAKYVEITECPPEGTSDTYAPQGLIVTLPDDGYFTQFGLPPGLIWSIGDNSWRSKASVAAPAMTLAAGVTSETLGRKNTNILFWGLASVGTVLLATADTTDMNSVYQVMIGMFLGGLGVYPSNTVAFVLLSFLVGWLPMKFGLRRLKNFEA